MTYASLGEGVEEELRIRHCKFAMGDLRWPIRDHKIAVAHFKPLSRLIVYPVVPVELMQSVVQLVVYFITAAGATFGLLLCSRA